MKRKLLIFSVLAICAAILAAGTIAFFNAEGKAHNVITTGGVGQRSISAAPWATPTRTPPRPSTLRPKASKRQTTARRHWRRPDGRNPTKGGRGQ